MISIGTTVAASFPMRVLVTLLIVATSSSAARADEPSKASRGRGPATARVEVRRPMVGTDVWTTHRVGPTYVVGSVTLAGEAKPRPYFVYQRTSGLTWIKSATNPDTLEVSKRRHRLVRDSAILKRFLRLSLSDFRTEAPGDVGFLLRVAPPPLKEQSPNPGLLLEEIVP